MIFRAGDRVIRIKGHRAGDFATVLKDSGGIVYVCFDNAVSKEENWACSNNSIGLISHDVQDGYDID